MDTIQIIWLAIPGFILLIGLYGYLEGISKSVKKQNPKDYFKSGLFALVTALICLALDSYFLASIVSYLPDILPILFYRIILFPVVMYILAVSVGGTKPVSIQKKNNKN